MQKLRHIDSLRGVAILMVMLVHIGVSIPELPWLFKKFTGCGQAGVQLFFVISAYTLCLSAERREGEINGLQNYFLRRFFRIAPLYYIAILFYFIIQLIENSYRIPEEYTFINIVANVLFIHGFYPPANNNIVPGGWSIGTEMAFYVLFPLIYNLYKKYGSQIILKILLISSIGNIVVQILALTVFHVHGSMYHRFVYYNLINQFSVFILGILLFDYHHKRLVKLSLPLQFILFLALTFLSTLLMGLQWKMPLLISIFPFLSGLSFLFLFNLFKEIEPLNLKMLSSLGKVSFSAYIVHFVFADHIAKKINDLLSSQVNSFILFIILFLGTVVSTFMISKVTERLIEKKGLELGNKLIALGSGNVQNKS